MTPGRILFAGLLLVAGVLYLLNPGPEKFTEFLSVEMAAQAEARAREAGEVSEGVSGGAASFLAGRLGRRAGEVASDSFEREDYRVASIYTADMNGRQPGGDWRFLGIAGWFVAIEQPEETTTG
ncbi:MAG: hypothetical protein AAGK21_06775 [Bacteroidota bacterium]